MISSTIDLLREEDYPSDTMQKMAILSTECIAKARNLKNWR